MAKNKISEYSSTAASNTDVANINIAEGCSPSNINNAIRAVMSHLKNFQDGSSGDSVTVGGNLSVTGTTTLSGTATATTQSAGDNSTKLATTAYVDNEVGSLGTISTQDANNVTITGGSITGITDLTVADGGTGVSTLSANAVLLGNGTSALQTVAPSTSGNVLTSNGTTWTSAAAANIGVGQTWQNVTGSRSAGTNYTNSTGKPIFISVFGSGSPSNAVMSMTVDGIVIGRMGSAAVASGVFSSTMTAIVPNGSTYRVDNVNGWTLGTWSELR